MYGLFAGWIKEVQKIKTKEPDIAFLRHCALTFAAFEEEHWICDTDGPEIVFFIVNEVAKLWRYFFGKSNEILKTTDVILNELKTILKLLARKFKSLSEDFEHPIEFVITNTRLKHKIDNYDLDDIIQMSADIKRTFSL